MTHYTVTPEHLKRELELAEYLSKNGIAASNISINTAFMIVLLIETMNQKHL